MQLKKDCSPSSQAFRLFALSASTIGWRFQTTAFHLPCQCCPPLFLLSTCCLHISPMVGLSQLSDNKELVRGPTRGISRLPSKQRQLSSLALTDPSVCKDALNIPANVRHLSTICRFHRTNRCSEMSTSAFHTQNATSQKGYNVS